MLSVRGVLGESSLVSYRFLYKTRHFSVSKQYEEKLWLENVATSLPSFILDRARNRPALFDSDVLFSVEFSASVRGVLNAVVHPEEDPKATATMAAHLMFTVPLSLISQAGLHAFDPLAGRSVFRLGKVD